MLLILSMIPRVHLHSLIWQTKHKACMCMTTCSCTCSPLLCPGGVSILWCSKKLAILIGLLIFLVAANRFVTLATGWLFERGGCCWCCCCVDTGCVSVDTPGEMVGVAVILLLLAVECCGECVVWTGASHALIGEPNRRPMKIKNTYTYFKIYLNNCWHIICVYTSGHLHILTKHWGIGITGMQPRIGAGTKFQAIRFTQVSTRARSSSLESPKCTYVQYK